MPYKGKWYMHYNYAHDAKAH